MHVFDAGLYQLILLIMLLTAPLVFVVLFYVSAPYGRHTRGGWGMCFSNRIGWLVMESPACLLVLVLVVLFADLNLPILVMLLIWQSHYVYRAFVYPFSLKENRNMPVSVIGMALVFNSANAYLIAGHFAFHTYSDAWFVSPAFLLGTMLFFAGMLITRLSDRTLRQLSEDNQGYNIPAGGMYQLISCPNYLGEIIQWLGWAVLTWSTAGFVFLIWTMANLIPRAVEHHRWYQQQFPDYPKNRKAIIPYVW